MISLGNYGFHIPVRARTTAFEASRSVRASEARLAPDYQTGTAPDEWLLLDDQRLALDLLN
jgi:hypothetical protein